MMNHPMALGPLCASCGYYPGQHPQFARLYHAASPAKRHSIKAAGLRVEFDNGEGYTEPGIYMSPRPGRDSGQDIWEVSTSGVRLHPGTPSNLYEFRDVGGSYFSTEDLPPGRLRLHRAGTGNQWTGWPPKPATPQPQKFFHGAVREFDPGELAEPGHPPNFPASSPDYVYFTATAGAAAQWAQDAAEMPHDHVVRPRVYQVQPTGEYERDPKGDNPFDFQVSSSAGHLARGAVGCPGGLDQPNTQAAAEPPASTAKTGTQHRQHRTARPAQAPAVTRTSPGAAKGLANREPRDSAPPSSIEHREVPATGQAIRTAGTVPATGRAQPPPRETPPSRREVTPGSSRG